MPDQDIPVAQEVIQALSALVPQEPIALYVPQSAVPAFQEAADSVEEAEHRISVYADDWPHWIAGANSASPDLMTGLGSAAGSKINLRRWGRAPGAGKLALLLYAAVL